MHSALGINYHGQILHCLPECQSRCVDPAIPFLQFCFTWLCSVLTSFEGSAVEPVRRWLSLDPDVCQVRIEVGLSEPDFIAVLVSRNRCVLNPPNGYVQVGRWLLFRQVVLPLE